MPPPRLHLQHASRAPELMRQTPPRLHACSAPPETNTSTCLHVPRPTACLPSFRSLEANTSTSPGPQHASRAPDLLRQMPPHLHACSVPPDLSTFTSFTTHNLTASCD